jgi:TolA-binding protein
MKTSWGTNTDMVRGMTIAIQVSASEEYNLYRPEKVQSQSIPAPGSAVLTKTIVIQKGDTLSKLSRRYSGRSAYFPQILLFNRIKNPDLIYAGAFLQVPLISQVANAGQEREKPSAAKSKRHTRRKSTIRNEKRMLSAPADSGINGARLFKHGIRAFKARHYRHAIDIFDNYLKIYPNSPNAPDAMLYRAECYMKLSGQ